MYKMIATDLDGTFLNSKMEITPENDRAISALQERGVLLVPASGRAFYELDEALRENPLLRYYICSDGSVVFDKKTGKRDTACMDRALAAKVFDIFEEYQVFLVIHCDAYSFVDAERMAQPTLRHYRISPYYGSLMVQRNRLIKNFRDFYRSREEIELISGFFHSDEEMAECRKRMEALEGVQVVSSEPGTFEVISSRAGKGNGILKLAKILEMDPSQIIAAGDSANDLSMLSAAGLSLAVANAWDEVKAAADQVICSNDEHIAQYILEKIIKE